MPLSSWLLSSVPGAQPSPAPIVPYPLQSKPRGVTRSPTPFKSRFTPSNDKVGGNPGLWNKKGKDGDAVRLGNSFCARVRSGCFPNCLQLAGTDANQSVKAGLHPLSQSFASLAPEWGPGEVDDWLECNYSQAMWGEAPCLCVQTVPHTESERTGAQLSDISPSLPPYLSPTLSLLSLRPSTLRQMEVL